MDGDQESIMLQESKGRKKLRGERQDCTRAPQPAEGLSRTEAARGPLAGTCRNSCGRSFHKAAGMEGK